MRRLLTLLVLVTWTGAVALAGEPQPAKPGPKDRCPVCGMFVAPFPGFQAQMAFSDGSYAFFDGAKDLFKHYLGLRKDDPTKLEQVVAVFVTDYYGMEPVDGHRAYYVVGSDVHGPMGAELIAFRSEEAATEFKKDHKGKSILKFDEVTEETLRTLK
jgi:nitrous oxide reductase accessory protein NosL